VKAEAGDKLRIKVGAYAGNRGLLETIDGHKLVVRIEGSGLRLIMTPDQVTNFSLAARKAWVTGPDRAVGRPKGTKLCDRVSVTLRIDRDLWENFTRLEGAGLIEDRTAVINSWFWEKLAQLEKRERHS
jgi:hypothetical protein